MTKTKEFPCVLCDCMAQFEHHNGAQMRYYESPKCRFYAISERAIRHLKQNPESRYSLAQEAANMPHDVTILEITYDTLTHIKTAKVPRDKYL
jgi:hypothetical protein